MLSSGLKERGQKWLSVCCGLGRGLERTARGPVEERGWIVG